MSALSRRWASASGLASQLQALAGAEASSLRSSLLGSPSPSQDRCSDEPCCSTSSSSPSWPWAWQTPSSQRGYRIPIRVRRPDVPYSARSGRSAPQPWPEFERISLPDSLLREQEKQRERAGLVVSTSASEQRGQAQEGEAREQKLQRAVLRFPADVSVELQGRVLVLSGKAGTVSVNLEQLDPTGVCGFKLLQLPSAPAPAGASPSAGAAAGATTTRPLLAVVGAHKGRFDALCAQVQGAVQGCSQGFLLGLSIKGVGYRVEPVDDPLILARAPKRDARRPQLPGGAQPKPWFFEKPNPAAEKQAVPYPHPKPTAGLRFKVGYSRTAVYALPPGVRAFLVKPTQFYLYGLDQEEVRRVGEELRSIRKPNPYTGNGIQFTDEVIKLKQRAGTK